MMASKGWPQSVLGECRSRTSSDEDLVNPDAALLYLPVNDPAAVDGLAGRRTQTEGGDPPIRMADPQNVGYLVHKSA